MLDKVRQYRMLYFSAKFMELAQETYFALLDIDCNYSKLICELLSSILSETIKITKKGKSYRHYNWKVVTTLKRSKHGKKKKG